jgi:hypothetical protein
MTTGESHVGGGIGAGTIVFLITMLPAMLIAIAGANGSLGDLSQVELIGPSIVLAILIAGFAGWSMERSLRRADTEHRSPVDAWAAFFVGLALFVFLITLVPALILLALFPDEGQSLDASIAGLGAVWIGGYILAAAAATAAARAFFERKGPTDRQTLR